MRARWAIVVAASLFAQAGGAQEAAPSAPPMFGSDAPMLTRANDVADYTLRATLDPIAHTVHGEGTIRWRNASQKPVKELWLHLYLNAFKNQASVFMREPVGGFRGNV